VAAACDLEARIPDSEVVAVTLGPKSAAETLRSAMAMGADRGIHLVSERWYDPQQTAVLLAAAIKRDGDAAVVFTGKEAIDREGGVLPFYLGARMDLPAVSNVSALKLVNESAVEVTNELGAGSVQILQMPIPCVIGAGKALSQPNYPTLPDIIKAKKKPIQTVTESDFEDPSTPAKVERVALRPSLWERKNELIDGPLDQAVATLIERLKTEAKVI
jgi:electron transfer flavoprotein beta subunit